MRARSRGRSYRHPPYTGKDSGPKLGCIGLAKVKRGRLVSLEASFDSGTVLTKPLELKGSTLLLNANAAYGTIGVGLLDETGQPIAGWESAVQGKDAAETPVAFKQPLAALAGKPTRLRFTLKNAQLFGFQVK